MSRVITITVLALMFATACPGDGERREFPRLDFTLTPNALSMMKGETRTVQMSMRLTASEVVDVDCYWNEEIVEVRIGDDVASSGRWDVLGEDEGEMRIDEDYERPDRRFSAEDDGLEIEKPLTVECTAAPGRVVIDCFAATRAGLVIGEDAIAVECTGSDAQVEVCDDGVDNDADGFYDCDDADCIDCVPEKCDDGVDNNGNGSVDCDDQYCVMTAPLVCGMRREQCDDGIDNDRDGLVDGDDPDCVTEIELDCDDGEDNDGNGVADCQDPACVANCPPGANCMLTDLEALTYGNVERLRQIFADKSYGAPTAGEAVFVDGTLLPSEGAADVVCSGGGGVPLNDTLDTFALACSREGVFCGDGSASIPSRPSLYYAITDGPISVLDSGNGHYFALVLRYPGEGDGYVPPANESGDAFLGGHVSHVLFTDKTGVHVTAFDLTRDAATERDVAPSRWYIAGQSIAVELPVNEHRSAATEYRFVSFVTDESGVDKLDVQPPIGSWHSAPLN